MELILEPTPDSFAQLAKRPQLNKTDLNAEIETVFQMVKTQGDAALLQYTQQWDGVSLNQLLVTEAELALAKTLVSDSLKAAIELAYQNIYTFHAAQREPVQPIETMPGVRCWRKSVPIQKIGLYIPGGTAPLFSTVLMLAIPANIAGCKEVVLCTPPQNNGSIHPAILYTAQRCGIKTIVKVGGAQAIAAMVFGTASVPAVYKLFGPGNQYVTAAKQKALQYGVAIDMPAGPSEVLVYADETAIPAFVAADLLAQAEHGKDSQVILVCPNQQIAETILNEVKQQTLALPRKLVVNAALLNSKAIVLSNPRTALDFINEYAPEHLILACTNSTFFSEGVYNAGSVFIGNYTPESAGDYASGTNHTLPTNAYAKTYSGVSLDSFIKKITYQHINETGLQAIGSSIMTMAEAELLHAHKQAVEIRLNYLQLNTLNY